jgi:organic anion transporter 3A
MTDVRKYSGKSAEVGFLDPPPRCGIGTWTPAFIQPMANIRIFLFFLCGYAIFYGMIPSLLVSQLSTIEKVFGFTSSMSGMIVSSYEIGFLVTIIFVGHFGDRLHTPRIIGAGGLIFGLCGLLYSLLHLMSNRKLHTEPEMTTATIFDPGFGFSNNTTIQFVANVHLCVLVEEPVNVTQKCSSSDYSSSSTVTYAIFILITIVSGFAATPVWTIAITYLDDNSGCRRKSSLYIGKFILLKLATRSSHGPFFTYCNLCHFLGGLL